MADPNDVTARQSVRDGGAAKKKAYSAPALVRWGSVEDLTGTGSGGANEGTAVQSTSGTGH